jgi:excisionase family DNA binding protein
MFDEMGKKTRIQGYYTVKEAAKRLGVSTMTLRRWDKAGKLEIRRHPMNNYRIFTKEDIEQIKKLIEGGE